MNFRQIFDLEIPPGKVAVGWFNSYSGIIVKTSKATLIFDPVKISLDECIQAEAIVITHEHLDHFDPELVARLQRKTQAQVLTTPFVARHLTCGRVNALRVNDHIAVGDVELHAHASLHPANQPLSFLISTESGIAIYHSDDSEPFPEMRELGEKYKPQILLFSGTSLEDGVQIAKLIEPKVVVSYYTSEELAKRFEQEIRKELPQSETKIIKRFEIYQYP